jgi:putative transposase
MNDRFADKYKIKSSRLLNFDYSTPGFYFITICTLNHNNFFGKIISAKMELNQKGIITKTCLQNIPNHFKNIILDEYVIMPNHIHLLLELTKSNVNSVETRHGASLQITYQSYHFHRLAIKSNQTIPKIINQFKSAVTKQINPKTIFFVWQPRYHDYIVKDKQDYFKIKNYIINNPAYWQKDKFFNQNVETPRRDVSTE